MKLHKVLRINGQPFELVSDDVRLDLRTPGRANFVIKADQAQRGLITLDMGYNDKPLQRHFVGYIERSTTSNSREQILFCREVAAILYQPLPMGLRHVNLSEVLREVSKKTGLRFRVPDTTYAQIKTPYFYSLAAGIQAMDNLAQVFSIPDFVWHQQGDGEVYVGSWADGFWGLKPPLQLPVELLNNYQGNRSATVAALPGLRPGATINQGERVTSVTLAGTEMTLQWKKP